MALKLANLCSSTLAAGISDTDTSLTVQIADAGKFPALDVGDWFPSVLEGGGNIEIIRVTARATDVLTIERAQEGTTALTWPAGTRVDLRLTVAGLDAFSPIPPDGSIANTKLADMADATIKLRALGAGSGPPIDGSGAQAMAILMADGQIPFPASQNASSDPNTLDDYEEGTWTPGLTFGGNAVGITYGGLNYGRYTKIGNLCIASATLQLTNKGSSTGAALLMNLPFTSSNDGSLRASANVGLAAGFSTVTGAVIGLVLNNDTRIGLYHSNNGNAAQLSNAHFTNGSQIHVTAAYPVA